MSLETLAGQWWAARQAGQRLPEHELRCVECGEPSEPPVCALCIETQLQQEVQP